jgi:hypothetical protein
MKMIETRKIPAVKGDVLPKSRKNKNSRKDNAGYIFPSLNKR